MRKKQLISLMLILTLLITSPIIYLIRLPQRDPTWIKIGSYIKLVSPSLYTGFKQREQKSRLSWFEDLAQGKEVPLHAASGWGYMSREEYNSMVYHVLREIPIRDNDVVFELGCGVGAVLQLIREVYGNNVLIGGSDLSVQAIRKARQIFPGEPNNFFVASMTKKNDAIPDNSKDHVISFGALAMYLYKEEMLKALEEALRITKPGGHLCFTHFIEPTGKGKWSILEPIEKSFWYEIRKTYLLENLKVQQMMYQKDRYFVCFSKPKIS